MGDSHPEKSLFSRNFCCYETTFLVSERFTDFCVTVDNFLVSVGISYCRSEVIIFLFYQELNAVQSKKSTFTWGLSHILPVFGKISVLTQSDSGFKKYELWKKSIFQQLNREVANFANIKQNNTIFAQKKGGRNSF